MSSGSLVTYQNQNFGIRRVLESGDSGDFLGGKEEKTLAVRGDLSRAIGPERLYLPKPVAELTAKKAIGRVFDGAKLVGKPAWGEQRDSNGVGIQRPGLPDQPHVKVQYTRRVG